jgi:hypothetical protein
MASEPQKLDSSVALNDLLFAALDHAVESVRTGEDLIPFILTEGVQGQRAIRRFFADRLEWAVSEAKAAASSLTSEVLRYAISYDGYLTVAGERFDTVVVEGGERGAGPGWSLGQRYRKSSAEHAFEVVGNPVLLGKIGDRFEGSA